MVESKIVRLFFVKKPLISAIKCPNVFDSTTFWMLGQKLGKSKNTTKFPSKISWPLGAYFPNIYIYTVCPGLFRWPTKNPSDNGLAAAKRKQRRKLGKVNHYLHTLRSRIHNRVHKTLTKLEGPNVWWDARFLILFLQQAADSSLYKKSKIQHPNKLLAVSVLTEL